MSEIADNIRRDMAAAGVPWKQFQHVLAMICLLSSDPVTQQIGRKWLTENAA